MKKIVYGVLIVAVTLLVLVNLGAMATGTPFLTYVYSQSMEPLVHVNDAFFVLPAKSRSVGDIIVYRPLYLDAELVTHRIHAIEGKGFITKGDNNPYTDQSSGEPAVTPYRIAGKVFTIAGRPLIIPQLGRLTSLVKKGLGSNIRLVASAMIVLGVLNLLWSMLYPKRSRKSRRRFRLRHIYRIVTIISIGILMVTLLIGSRVTQVRYLVSENPGTASNRVMVNENGQLSVTLRNSSLIPVWHFSSGLGELGIASAPSMLLPLSETRILVSVKPQRETGWQQGYIHTYQYPAVLPHFIIAALHRQSHWLALAAIGLVVYLYLSLFFRLINIIPGLEGWIPLKAIKDKLLDRRWRRAKRKYLLRKRVRL